MIGNKSGIDYITACYGCGATADLQMFAHRNEDELIVGQIFVCKQCRSKVVDRTLTLKESSMTNNERKKKVREILEVYRMVKFSSLAEGKRFLETKVDQILSLPPRELDEGKILKVWEDHFKQLSNEWDKEYAKLTIQAYNKERVFKDE